MLTNNGEPKPSIYGTDTYDERYEGSTRLYAEHLIKDHGYDEGVLKIAEPNDSSAWVTLNALHRTARNLDQ